MKIWGFTVKQGAAAAVEHEDSAACGVTLTVWGMVFSTSMLVSALVIDSPLPLPPPHPPQHLLGFCFSLCHLRGDSKAGFDRPKEANSHKAVVLGKIQHPVRPFFCFVFCIAL